MGIDASEVGAHIKRLVIFIVRTCYRSVCDHPFFVTMVLFVAYLYGSAPFLFSLLASSSPVIICTAVLLGTLLSYGQPNIPEIEKQVEKARLTASLKTTMLSEDAASVAERDVSCAERFMVKRRSIEKKTDEDTKGSIRLVDRDNSSSDRFPLMDESSHEIQCEEQVNEHVRKDKFDRIGSMGANGNDAKVEIQCSQVAEGESKNRNGEHGESPRQLVDDLAADRLISSPRSWKPLQDDVSDDAGSLDSDSDQAESSSPDASMADIIPMLDELHPLLDLEAPQIEHDDHDASSQQSNKSSEGSDEPDEDTANQEEDGEDDIDEEEEAQVGEDTAKSAITWTEDDQKNLMNLGNSELERNQRLENLIAKRRARKSMRMVAEKNLIDLEGTDHSFQVASISTAKHNPFDLPDDSIDELDLLAIPGSAPSILLPGRNPFDAPYKSNEEKPVEMGNVYQQQFMPLHQKDALFRRHESFSIGALGASRQDRQDMKLRPFFVPERISPVGTGYSSFQGQSSATCDSKLNSVADTILLGSENKKITGHGLPHEAEMISNMDHASVSVQSGSTSSEYTDSEDEDSEESDQAKRSDADLDKSRLEDDHGEVEPGLRIVPNLQQNLSETTAVTRNVELNESSINLKTECIEEKCGSSCSPSPASVRSGGIIDEKKHDGVEMADGAINSCDTRDPVYDSSPPAIGNLFSSSSVSSDIDLQTSQTGSPPQSIKPTVPFADKESEVHKDGVEKESVAVNKTEILNKQQPSIEINPSSREAGLVQNPSDEEDSHRFGEAPTGPSTVNLVDIEEIPLSGQAHNDSLVCAKDDFKTEDGKLISSDSSYHEEKSSSELDKQLPAVERMVEQSLDVHKEVQERNIPILAEVPKADLNDKIVSTSSTQFRESVHAIDTGLEQVLDGHPPAELIHSPRNTEHINKEPGVIEHVNGREVEGDGVISLENDIYLKKINEVKTQKQIGDGPPSGDRSPETIKVEHVHERSDIDMASKEVHEGDGAVDESKECSLQTAEATTLEGTDPVVKPHWPVDLERMPEVLNAKDGLAGKVKGVALSSMEAESSAKEVACQELGTSTVNHDSEGEYPNEVLGSSMSAKSKSLKSSSDSSSSSSDSD